MKTMMRYSCGILLVVLLLTIGPKPTYAQNHVRTIDIEAVIYDDGSMYITQVWEGDFDEGTEIYIPMAAPDYLQISDLRVADHNGVYQVVEPWDLEAGFAEKASKCGLNYTEEGYEICFGLSEYGTNRYAIEYRLKNVIGSYTDLDGVNFRFANKGMNTTPTDVKVDIRLADGTPLKDEGSDIWAFGYEGQVLFEDGAIRAYTEKPLTEYNHVTVMLSLEKGLLNPSRTESVSFAEVREQAFQDSDYDDEGSGEEVSALAVFLTVALSIGIPLALILLISKLRKRSAAKKMQEFGQRWGYFREVPNSGNVQATYALGRLFELCEEGAILGTGMLRLIQLGCLAPVRLEEVGFMGKTKEIVSLELKGSNHKEMNEYDEYLYTVLEGAAGSDGILQPKELPRFAERNDTLLRNYLDQSNAGGLKYLQERQCLTSWEPPLKLKHLTPSGEKELGELVGFKQYLEDFSLVAERGVETMPIWQELLSYALLFGIADKVAEQMQEVYPQLGREVEQYSQNLKTSYAYSHLLVTHMLQAEERRAQAARSKGSGGFSSLGGGGGSIGGGRGGGTR
ncbi:putative membrane protein (DUF2207) [Desulfitobacterium dichloroeliminans LMG P-21439]|uniref:Putative membrane protein (DUF2207) n=1 Tax=Desulfitobacterium dichloroeliminans (strain LMG P-21439 / DCA1) TaxID=871963 RepID=L0F6Z6_DESDL|nr:DUF2207 domain-containing protein [Desulfitobacterium dichloroeliminans]AGA68426.1 putative membrane protein (DUF2207) [Desulfitobacterium dichloroeliminans LMG P-21439]